MKNLDVMTHANWTWGGATGFARYEFSESFVDENGVEYGAGPNSYLEVPTTIAGNVVTIPSYLNFPETEAAIINNGVTVTCYLLDSNRVKRTTLFEAVRIYTSLPATVSLSQLVLANGASRLLRDTDVWTKEQVMDYVSTFPGLGGKATALAYGNVRLDVAAANPADPEVIGSNSPVILNREQMFNPKAYGAVCDGVTDDTAAFQAAVAALISAGGGTLVIPESTAGMLVGGAAVANQIVNITIPCTVRGSGTRSVILVAAATGATTDVIRVSPPTTITPEYGLVFPEAGSGYIFRDFVIRAASGTPARHGIHVELAAGSFFSQSLFSGIFFDDLGGRSIYFNNGVLNTDGIFLVTVDRCYPSGGIYAIGFGDSNTIQNSRFWGDGNVTNGRAVEIASFIAGAGNLRLLNNNITQKGGVSISGGTGHQIRGNFIELYRVGSTGTDGAVLSIKGGAAQAAIENNLFGSLNGNTLNGVRVGTSSAVSIDANYYNLPATTRTVVLDADADAAWIGGQGHLVGGGTGTLNNSATAQNPVYSNNNGRTTRTGSLSATSAGNTEIITGFTGSAANIAIFEINRNVATSDDTGFAALVGATNQSGTANAIFSIYAANVAIGGAEKRIGIISAATDGATNTGRWDFYTANAGTLGIRFKIKKNTVSVMGLTAYANNAAAIAGGLVAGDLYRTSADPSVVCVVT